MGDTISNRFDRIDSTPPRHHPTPAEETALSATPALTTTDADASRASGSPAPARRSSSTFALAGLVFASWASRIADAKDALGPHRRAARADPARRERRLGHRACRWPGGSPTGSGPTRAVALGMGLSARRPAGGRAGRRRPRPALAAWRPGSSSSASASASGTSSMNLEGADVERHLGTLGHAALPRGLQRRHGRLAPSSGPAMSLRRRAARPCTSSAPSVVTVALAWWALPRFLPALGRAARAAAAARPAGGTARPGSSRAPCSSAWSSSRRPSPRAPPTTGSPWRSSRATASSAGSACWPSRPSSPS